MRYRPLLSVVLLGLLGCTSYEYEEEIFLNVDGSGRVRVSGSRAFLESVDSLYRGELESIETSLSQQGFEVDSVRETRRDARAFIHVQGGFSEWNQLCSSPLFASRDCGLARDDDGLTVNMTIRESGGVPTSVAPDAPVAVRFHFPSAVRFHNSKTGIERGNIIRWQRSAEQHFGGSELYIEARFEQRSILRTTAVILGTAFGLVVVTVVVALSWIYLKGRRQLAADAGNSIH